MSKSVLVTIVSVKKVTSKLHIDLETYVIDYEEIKDILKSYMKASLPWDCGAQTTRP